MSNTPTQEAIEQYISTITRAKQNQGYKKIALHEYHNDRGDIIYWRFRFKHPITGEKYIRPFHFSDKDNKFILKEPEFLPDQKPLYNLSKLANSSGDQTIFIVEGEWCCDHLTKLGLLATTSGSSSSVDDVDWSPLCDRTIIIWPDNDHAGISYAKNIILKLQSLNCSISQIDINQLNLAEKEDCVDWLIANPSATSNDILNLPIFNIIQLKLNYALNESTYENISNEENTGKRSQASALVDFVLEHVELFHDMNREVYAQDLSTKETRRLDGRQFKDWLVASFYEVTLQSPREQSMREAFTTLSGLARYRSPCYQVFVRVAYHDNAYYLDLAEAGKCRVIRIEPGKWEIINDPPVRFLRPETLWPLPEPNRNGDLAKLWQLVNIPESDRFLIIAWLIECLRLDTPFPVLELIGEQGSAKSTTQNILRQLIDPNACNLRASPKSVEDIYVSAGTNWLVSYENISHLSAPAQDAICILATGGGFAKRKLYSDADETVINVKRPVVLNGISAAVTAQDLIDRTISIETPLITDRSDITNIQNTFKLEHANFLGALLNIFAQALFLLPNITLKAAERPRLIEFACLGMAVAGALKKETHEFLQQFNNSRQESIARTIDASPVASALIEWFETTGKQAKSLSIKNLFEQVGAVYNSL